jgi:hypothetical protein
MNEHTDDSDDSLKPEFSNNFFKHDFDSKTSSRSSMKDEEPTQSAPVVDRDECYYFTDVIFLVHIFLLLHCIGEND